MNINNDEKSDNNKSPTSLISSSPNNTKKEKDKEKKKRNRKKKNGKNTKSKSNIFSENKLGNNILSEIKQISIPSELSEKENLFKILQSEILTIDKSLSLLNKKKKYYNEIIQKLTREIQNEKKNLKKEEIKNKEYLFLENILKDFDINDTFENTKYKSVDSYYKISKNINKNLDYDIFSLNQKNNKNYLQINFFDEKNNKINNKMDPNYQLSYEEFNTISELDGNFCLLMTKENSNMNENINNSDNKNNEDMDIINNNNESNINDDNKIIPENEGSNNNNINIIEPDISDTPYRNKFMEGDGEFTIINEVPPEEEETTIKNRKKLSVENSNDKNIINNGNNNKNKNKIIDSGIKKYSNNFEEYDFYILKDSRKKETKEIKKKKITFEEIQKKYKTQDMGLDFINKEEDSHKESNSPEEENNKENPKNKKNPKKKKIKKIKDSNSYINKNEEEISNIDNSEANKNDNDFSDNSELSKDNEDNKKKRRKKGRKKKEKEEKLYSLEELPNPENLDSVALALEMKKYGMKPQNKKRNIEILKSVYNFLRIKELPENISRQLASFDLDSNFNNTDSENDNNIKNKNKGAQSIITDLSNDQKKNIIEIIKDNKNIYEKILLFQEVSLKEIKTILNSKGIIVPNQLLSKLLLNSGVILPGGWNNKK